MYKVHLLQCFLGFLCVIYNCLFITYFNVDIQKIKGKNVLDVHYYSPITYFNHKNHDIYVKWNTK